MPAETLIPTQYADNFRCIGPACEDSCCENWVVPVDRPAYEKYQALPAGPLRTLVDANLLRAAPASDGTRRDGTAPAHFATIRMLPSGACPFLTAERLCQIQAEQGEGHLCHTCATFPRTAHTIDGCEDIALALSCPEAARLVLLDPELAPLATPPAVTAALNGACQPIPLKAMFWPIRSFTFRLIRNRAYPLWQRMFLLGTFARRFEAIASGELKRPVPELLRDFQAAVDDGGLRASMETIAPDLKSQLEMLLGIISLRTLRTPLGPRLLESLNAFRQGLGLELGAPLDTCLDAYAKAFERYYAPFFLARPHILENYLINSMVRKTFPFGKALLSPDAQLEPKKVFTGLTVEFTLIKGLLIGVAGFYKESFNEQHVVQTVQTAFRHFEHHPSFLAEAQALLAARSMNDARGLTMLLRN